MKLRPVLKTMQEARWREVPQIKRNSAPWSEGTGSKRKLHRLRTKQKTHKGGRGNDGNTARAKKSVRKRDMPSAEEQYHGPRSGQRDRLGGAKRNGGGQ